MAPAFAEPRTHQPLCQEVPVVVHTIKLSDHVSQLVAEVAGRAGVTKSEVIRSAIEQYLDFHAGRGANPNRLAELAEFNQLVLDQILKREFPDLREQVLDAVDKRLGKFHGR
jgi:hypothetical protein